MIYNVTFKTHICKQARVSVQGVKSLGGHFACLCRGFEFYKVRNNFCYYFSKRKWKYFYTFNLFIVKSLQKEQNSTNLLLPTMTPNLP